MCRHIRDRQPCPRWARRPTALNVDRFRQPSLLPLRTSYGRSENCSCSAQGKVRTIHPRTTWRPLTLLTGSPVFLPCASHLRYLSTPTRRYHGRTLIRLSPSACSTPTPKVLAHTQVQDPCVSAAACLALALETTSPWPRHWRGNTHRSWKQSVFSWENDLWCEHSALPDWLYFWGRNSGWSCSTLRQSSCQACRNWGKDALALTAKI